MVFLVMLLAVGGRALTTVAKGLIAASIVINLAGAVVFDRFGDRFVVADYDHVFVLGGLTSVAN